MFALNQQSVEQAVASLACSNPPGTQGLQPLTYHARPQALEKAEGTVGAAVIHLGLGGFHRAHQALVFDELIARGDDRWAVCAVGMRQAKLVSQLQAQDHLYLVRVSDAEGSHWHAPSSIIKTLVAATDRDAVIEQIANPQARWLTLTVTEKAYTPQLGKLIVQGLSRRQQKGLGGLTVASCDNLPDNGQVLRAICLAQAQAADDAALRYWIQAKCRFPSSMVDRIVPAPSSQVRAAAQQSLGLDDPSALGVESFWEWVIEDAFVDPSDADALRSVGVQVTSDVSGYEQAKLWMLNATHTALASAGVVLGDQFIREVIARPALRQFAYGYMTHTSGPLVGRPNWQSYRDALLARFSNPLLDHACLQVYSDSSLKISVRWVPVGERWLGQSNNNLQEGHEELRRAALDHLAMAMAIFVRSLLLVNEQGNSFVFDDPLAGQLQALAQDQQSNPRSVIERLLLPSTKTDCHFAVFGDRLGHDPAFVQSASHYLARIHAIGLEAAVRELL